MEFHADETSHQHPKGRKSINNSQLPSKDSILKLPVLPEELVTEIILRLPVKSLLKFKSVSKSWLALISSPKFINTHLSISANNKEYRHHKVMLRVDPTDGELKNYSLASLLHDESVMDASDMNYPVEDLYGLFWIVGSVNGLICFAGAGKVFLWNPSIRKYKKLPDFKTEEKSGIRKVTHGLGYDEIHDDYKVVLVVCVYQRQRLYHLEVKVYSLKSDSWRSIDHPQNGVKNFSELGKFVNGKLHWATNDGYRRKGWNIVSIDLTCEKWGAVELPCYGKGNGVFSLGVYGSNLSIVCTKPTTQVDVDVRVADVWVLKEYDIKESWTKMFTVKYPYVQIDYQFSPSFCLSNTGEILLIFGSTCMIYNPKDDSTRYPNYTVFGSFGVAAEIYFESLVSPLLQTN